MKFYQDLAIVEARLEGVGRPVQLAIDSGAPTTVTRGLAPQLAFSADSSVPTDTAFTDASGRGLEFEPVLLERLELGQLTFRDLPALLVPSPLFDRNCASIDGLLGTAGRSAAPGFLDRVVVEIDRDCERVRFSQDGPLREDRGATIPLKRMGARTYVPTELEGQFVWAELDTGHFGLSEMTRDLFASLLGRSVEDQDVRRYIGEHGVSLGGPDDRRSWVAMLREVHVGTYFLRPLPFRIVEPREEGVSGVVLTQGVLRYFNIVLDYPRSRMELSPMEALPSIDLPLQLHFGIRDGRFEVAGMLEGGIAQQAGIGIGDEVVAINGTRVSVADFATLCQERMSALDLDTVRLTLRKGDREYEVNLPRIEPW